MSFQNILADFYLKLAVPENLPPEVEVLNPYRTPETQEVVGSFFEKYYSDFHQRILLIGINPGRFGGGVTGIGFTDPVNLNDRCGIANTFPRKHELSSVFMYQMIDAMGGTENFFSRFLFSSVSPLGFVANGKNLNYYEINGFRDKLEPFLVASLAHQFSMGGSGDIAFCIGRGENYKYLSYLNSRYKFCKVLEVLPHPRWVLQYRRKSSDQFIGEYVNKLSACQ